MKIRGKSEHVCDLHLVVDAPYSFVSSLSVWTDLNAMMEALKVIAGMT